MSEWISVDERLPELGRSVIVHVETIRNGGISMEACICSPFEGANEDKFFWQTPKSPSGRGYDILKESVKNWMPLPQPPEPAK